MRYEGFGPKYFWYEGFVLQKAGEKTGMRAQTTPLDHPQLELKGLISNTDNLQKTV